MDHTNKAIFFNRLDSSFSLAISDFFDIVGRFAFPLFCFLLVEGFYHTRSKIGYLRNMLFFAIISEIPFNLFSNATWLDKYSQNIFFTLAIALVVIWLIDEVRKRTKWWFAAMIVIVAVGCLTAMHFSVNYHYYGVLVPVVFYLLRQRPLIASIAGYLILFKQIWSFPAFLMINLYNGERGKQYKWLNYWFYPVHLFVLGLIRLWTE